MAQHPGAVRAPTIATPGLAHGTPPFVVVAQSQSLRGEEEPPFEGYICQVYVGVGRAGIDIDVYVYVCEGITTIVTLPWDQGDRNGPLLEVLTPSGKHHVSVVHSPQS